MTIFEVEPMADEDVATLKLTVLLYDQFKVMADFVERSEQRRVPLAITSAALLLAAQWYEGDGSEGFAALAVEAFEGARSPN